MDYYNDQDGLKYELQSRCHGITPYGDKRKEFPSKDNFVEIFHTIEEKMNADWHQDVNLGAAIAGDGLLTDHGIKHVQDVIQHAGDILSDVQHLTGYELFILLLSIHFHDVGNTYGRDEHEQQVATVIDELGDALPLSIPEKQFINTIATAHGGYIDGDKDTISHITADTKFGNVTIRPKVLASILRFADEISDDLRRSTIKDDKIPDANKVFHAYSKSLFPVSIEGETVILHYQIPYSLTQSKIGKGSTQVFLYDEILNRVTKCMRELEYCKKYASGFIKISSLSVTIEILQDKSFKPIKGAGDSFRLTLQGYPDVGNNTLESYMEKPTAITGASKQLKYKNGLYLQAVIAGGS